MDASGLIFVALAVAWAAFLIPKALQHHEESVRGRSVERFSERMRVLARREPTSARSARLVVTPERAVSAPLVTQKAVPPAMTAARRAAIARATKRRRNVLAIILIGLTTVTALAGTAVISWWYVAIPATVLVAWLVACRLMVRSERGQPVRRERAPAAPAPSTPAPSAAGVDLLEDTAAHAPITDEVADPDVWDPVPVTLPTYVSKPTAQRTVRTIDLDSTGVWSSGRSEKDSAMVREAEESARAERARRDDGQRAVGS